MKKTALVFRSLAFLPLLTLSACATQSGGSKPANQPAQTPRNKTFVSDNYGIRVQYPARLELRRSFQRSYLDSAHWKVYPGPYAVPGRAVVALVLPDSNRVTTGELRIGISRRPRALKTCTHPPAAVVPGSHKQIMISGVTFTSFKARDAGMSHYQIAHSYRAVHNATCYAVDILVRGTNPKVYDPPKKPPFTKADAFQQLEPIVHTLELLPPEGLLAPLPATYEGVVPCADCPGINYQLSLLPNHRYFLHMSYRERATDFNETGQWGFSDDKSAIKLSGGGQWAVLDNGHKLGALDGNGQPIDSGLDYTLRRQKGFTPPANMSSN